MTDAEFAQHYVSNVERERGFRVTGAERVRQTIAVRKLLLLDALDNPVTGAARFVEPVTTSVGAGIVAASQGADAVTAVAWAAGAGIASVVERRFVRPRILGRTDATFATNEETPLMDRVSSRFDRGVEKTIVNGLAAAPRVFLSGIAVHTALTQVGLGAHSQPLIEGIGAVGITGFSNTIRQKAQEALARLQG